jgi:succinyl-CoA synthetase alpha subunit
MSIIAKSSTYVLIQGITGNAARTHTKNMLDYGTKIIAGTRPGGGGEEVHGLPVYDSVAQAVEKHPNINTTILFVPPKGTKEAALEALDAGIKTVVMVAEHVPLHDNLEILEKGEEKGALVIGPNTPGLISPSEQTKLGFVPSQYFIPGPVGVASRSGTLTYEIVSRLTLDGIGQTTCIGVGGDPIVGTPFPRILEFFEKDSETKAILLIGEIGGTREEEAAEMIKDRKITKPVFVYLVGRTAPEGKRVGHAGALIEGNRGTIKSKLASFREAGVPVADTPADVILMAKEILKR